jgi:hypothetical protein
MEIRRSPAVVAQLKEATALRTKLIDNLTAALGASIEKSRSKKPKPKNSLLQTIELSAEGFAPILTSVPITELDRRASMLAGPFFTSPKHPIPETSNGMRLPVVQLDLSEMSELSGQELGNGLLQLWCERDWSSTNRGYTRVISRQDVMGQTLTPFEYSAPREDETLPMPEELIFNAGWDRVDVISGYESMGIQCQTGYLDVYTEDVTEEVFDLIADELERFQELTELDNRLHMFGSFYPIQYSAVDVGIGWKCLVHFPTWGSEGNAQVFYHLDAEGNIDFRFEESLR